MGIFYGLISAAAFGLIPLFTLPLMQNGISVETALAYRFTLATLIMGPILVFKKENLWYGWKAFIKLCAVSLFYLMAVVLFFYAFHYLPSGIVATINFAYPIMVLLIMVFFFHEKFRWQLGAAIFLAIAGVALLSLQPGEMTAIDGENSYALMIGVTLSLLAGLGNALYLVGLQVARLPKINGLVMTFYVMLAGSVFCLINGAFTGSLTWLTTGNDLFCAVMLALITAVISNLTLILAIRLIGSTMASILGVTEPLTAVFVGALVFGEKFTWQIAAGILLIMCAVLVSLRKGASN